MLNYVRCLRPFNLLIVGATQILVYWSYFMSINIPEINWVLNFPKIVLFSFITILITATGYLINDYFDYESDKLNDKKNRLPNKYLNLRIYYILVFLGFLLSFSFAVTLTKVLLVLIYIIAVGLLFFYSYKWKKQILIGNIVVSIFSAFVVIILLYAERDGLSLLYKLKPGLYRNLITQFLYFGIFAFLISLAREIIKDIEDMHGDRKLNLKTLPIVSGIQRARIMISFTLMLLLVILGFWAVEMNINTNQLLAIYSTLFIAMPILYLLNKLLSRQNNLNYNRLSKICKAIMVSGLTIFILYPWI